MTLARTGALLLLFSLSCSGESERAAKVALSPCHLASPGFPKRVAAKCGFVEVPEDHDRPAGRKIRLHVAVIEADTDRPRPDPLFFFAGGPGQAASESYLPLAGGFRKLRRDRAIVLVDQRGTGRSNPLTCESPPAALRVELTPAQEEEWIRRCRDSLSAKRELAQYTTTASIRDFDRVRDLLGHERINVYGISYGTRVALSYLRRYPRRVRSVILDGVVPQDVALPRVLSEGPARARALLLRRCQADPPCGKRYPDLAAELAAIEATIQQKPPIIEVTHPRTGKLEKVRLSWTSWSLTLRILGYASETAAILPLLIHEARARRDLRPLAAQSVYVADLLRSLINNGLESSVLCSEDWPFFGAAAPRPASRPAASQPSSRSAQYGEAELRSLARICRLWPTRSVPATFKEPVRSDVPALLLSGEIDPVTPPAYAARAAKTLSRARHLVVPGQGHGVVSRGCVPNLVGKFVDDASTGGLDASCTKTSRPMPFFVGHSGPEP